MDILPTGSGPTYIDNGDGTVRTEYPSAGWATWGPTPARVVITGLSWRARIRGWWLAVRIWVAEKVLRVDVDRGDW